MPATLTYPGVYIQEVPSGVRTITGVATSITAFFGRTIRGPLNRAVHCLSYADFVRNFGGAPTGAELALSVKQFYDNGGADAYVVRLASGAQAAGVSLLDLAGQEVLIARANVEGNWGEGLRLEVDYNTPSPGETFNLKVLLEEGGATTATELFNNLSMDNSSSRFAPTLVSQSSELILLRPGVGLGDLTLPTSTYNDLAQSFAGYSQSRRPLGTTFANVSALFDALINTGSPTTARHSFDISVNNSAYVTVNLSEWTNAVLTALGGIAALRGDLETRINTALNSLVPAPQVTVAFDTVASIGGQRLLTITSASDPNSNVRVRRSAANDIAAALLLGAENGGVEMARRSNFRPVPTGAALRLDDPVGALGNVDFLNNFTGLHQDQITGVTIDGTAIALNAAPNVIQTTAAGDPNFRDNLPGTSASGNNDGVREKLRIIAQAISNTAGLRYRAEVRGYELAILAKDGTINQTPAVAFTGPGVAAINPAVRLNTREYSFGPGSTSTAAASQIAGLDGAAPGFADFVGNPTTQTGFYALDQVDIFNLMVIPRDEGVSAANRSAIWGPASIYCQSRRAFLLIEAPDDWTNGTRPQVVQDTSLIGALRATVVKDHSAVFYPKVQVNVGGIVRTLGSSGAIAGLMARIDASRGVWKAAAGTEADLRGLAGLEVKLTDLENGVLNKLGVNCARSFVSGFVNWGARTMDGADDIGSEWKYIPIRRLALFLEESLYRGTQWVVFEPNDEPLWANIRLNVGAFMNGLFRQGAFQGTTPDKAFYVKCDSETTTQADRNLGIVNIEVGFAPLKPAEFVIIKIQQIAGDLT
jgi:phage tail sheath protein FI